MISEKELVKNCIEYIDVVKNDFMIFRIEVAYPSFDNGKKSFTPINPNGTPDAILATKGYYCFIEFKTVKGYQNKNQKIMEIKMKSKGIDYFVIKSFEEFQKLVDSI